MSSWAPVLRLCVAAASACAALAPAAAPAAAHDGGGSGATSYRSEVVDVPVEGVGWDVLAGDALLWARNDSDRELVVLGYQGEPYLRIVPGKGVFENQRSPATYLNVDRFGAGAVPPEADPRPSRPGTRSQRGAATPRTTTASTG